MIAQTAKTLSIALILLLIQGCRIIQVTSVGGAIESDSTAYDCAADSTCIIDLPGTAWPGDIFTAVPEPGYRFVGWADRGAEPSFCKGTTTPCNISPLPPSLTAYTLDAYLEAVFEPLDLPDLLPAATRGVFQLYPGQPGAVDTTTMDAPWALGPLQILQRQSAGMDIAANAHRLILGQLESAPDQFLLLAELNITVDSLISNGGLVYQRDYQDYSIWDIGIMNLELAKIDDSTLAIGTSASLDLALDAYTGAKPNIEQGPLGPYLGALDLGTALPNSLVYGLPALYGPAPAPGYGDTSLSQAKAVNSVFSVTGDDLMGSLTFFSDNAATYHAQLNQELSGYPAPTIYSGNTLASVNLAGLSVTDDVLPLLKSLVHDMDSIDYAAAIVQGGNNPFLNFEVASDPNSIFINYEFADQQARDDFTAAHLPPGFSLAPIRILDTDSPSYFLVLNMYQSGGSLVNGARAEWSVFVNDPYTNEPRFLVVQAAADSIAADSVNLLTQPEPVTHELVAPPGGSIESYVGEVENEIESLYFSSSIDWPQSPETRVDFHREFVVANDYIFWGNAVADRGLYNSSVFNRQAVLVDPTQSSFTDASEWAAYINATPTHSLVYLNPLDIVISAWWNLDEPYLAPILDGASPDYTALLNFKNGFYPNLVQGEATKAIRGEGLALSSTTVSDSVPTASYHFPLLDAAGLLTEAVGPGVHTPAAVALYDGESAGNYLTLNVYKRETDTCGVRAEWVTYIVGSDGRPDSLRIDATSSEACLEPVSLISLAADLSQGHNLVSNDIETAINTPFVQFDASVDLDATAGAMAGLDRLESGDYICSVNDVCDKFYIDGAHLIENAQQAEAADVTINTMQTPWDGYVDQSGVRADVRLTSALMAGNPWRNIRSYAAPAPIP